MEKARRTHGDTCWRDIAAFVFGQKNRTAVWKRDGIIEDNRIHLQMNYNLAAGFQFRW